MKIQFHCKNLFCSNNIQNLNANPDGIIWNLGPKFYENILDSQFHSDTSHESHIGLILRVDIECYLLNWLPFKSESSNGSRMQSKKGSKNMLNNSTNQTAVFSMLLLEFCVQNVRDRNNIVCIILILYIAFWNCMAVFVLCHTIIDLPNIVALLYEIVIIMVK